MTCYRWYIGHTDRNGAQLFNRVRTCLQEAFLLYFPTKGYTLYRATDYWEESSEETTIAELLINIGERDYYKLRAPELMALHLADVLNQECVLLTSHSVDAKFVERKPYA